MRVFFNVDIHMLLYVLLCYWYRFYNKINIFSIFAFLDLEEEVSSLTAAVVVLSLFLVTILILCAVYFIRRRSVLKHSSKFLNHWILMSFSGKYIKNVFAISISYHFKFCCFMFWKTDYFLNTLINLYDLLLTKQTSWSTAYLANDKVVKCVNTVSNVWGLFHSFYFSLKDYVRQNRHLMT